MAPAYAPFLRNGVLYTILQAAGPVAGGFTPAGGIYVYSSSDQGVTWTALDAANGPSRTELTPMAGFFWDGADTIIVAWIPNGGPLVLHAGAMNLKNFDLVTGTWGPTYGTVGAPSVWCVSQCFQRPDGSIIVLASPNFSGGRVRNFNAYVFSGGAWSSFAVDTNVPAPFSVGQNSGACMDSGGNVHFFMLALRTGPSSAQMFYQLVKSDNTLGTSATIQTGTPNLPGIPEWQPAISGDNVVIGLVDAAVTYPTIAVGTPLAAPVFTVLGAPGVDPNFPSPVNRIATPRIAVDATGLYASYFLRETGQLLTIRTAFSADLSNPLNGWNDSILAFDAAVSTGGSPTGWDFLGTRRDSGNLFGMAQTVTTGVLGAPTAYWLGAFAPVAAPPLIGSQGGGGVPVLGCQCCPPVRSPFKRRKLKTEWNAVPPGAKHVNVRGAAAGPFSPTPFLVVQYQVPNNRRFQLDALVLIGEAVNWTPGDGNVSFSLTVNQPLGLTAAQGVPFSDFGKVFVPLGSLITPWRIPRCDRITLKSREVLRLTVTANPAFMLPGTFVGVLQGYEW